MGGPLAFGVLAHRGGLVGVVQNCVPTEEIV